MKTEKEKLPSHITVDSSKAKRCIWCGRTKSNDWTGSYGPLYCSNECSMAYWANFTLVGFILTAISIPLLFTMQSSISLTSLVFGSVILITMFSPLLFCGVTGQYHRRKIPKDSQRSINTQK
ncbi:MAG: hypothetical protein ACFFCP_16405 [Promethearchaeota archaeon]